MILPARPTSLSVHHFGAQQAGMPLRNLLSNDSHASAQIPRAVTGAGVDWFGGSGDSRRDSRTHELAGKLNRSRSARSENDEDDDDDDGGSATDEEEGDYIEPSRLRSPPRHLQQPQHQQQQQHYSSARIHPASDMTFPPRSSASSSVSSAPAPSRSQQSLDFYAQEMIERRYGSYRPAPASSSLSASNLPPLPTRYTQYPPTISSSDRQQHTQQQQQHQPRQYQHPPPPRCEFESSRSLPLGLSTWNTSESLSFPALGSSASFYARSPAVNSASTISQKDDAKSSSYLGSRTIPVPHRTYFSSSSSSSSSVDSGPPVGLQFSSRPVPRISGPYVLPDYEAESSSSKRLPPSSSKPSLPSSQSWPSSR